jgi:hypothetical protein
VKREQRILASRCCSEKLCIALIARGRGRDAVLAGRDCRELCTRAEEKGFLGETRFYVGDCDCGLHEYPGYTPALEEAERLCRDTLEWERIDP